MRGYPRQILEKGSGYNIVVPTAGSVPDQRTVHVADIAKRPNAQIYVLRALPGTRQTQRKK